MVNGIPVWRLPRNVTYEECDEYMADLGVEMHYNTRVGRDIQVTDLLKEYDAVYIGAGCYVPNALTGPDNKVIPGADLKGVEDGIRLLAKTNYGDPAFIGKKCAVLGAGFTAMDCCRTAIRFGAEKVYVCIAAPKKRCLPTSMKSMRRCLSMSSSTTWSLMWRCSAMMACMSAA